MTSTGVTELDGLLARIVAIQKEITPKASAKTVYFYQQPGFPYWTNRLVRVEPTEQLDQNTWVFSIGIEMRFHAGAYTEGEDGGLESAIQGFIVNTCVAFKDRTGLESTVYPEEMDALEIGNISIVSRGVGSIPISSSGSAKGSIFDLGVFVTLLM
jgi:hypothetical protein